METAIVTGATIVGRGLLSGAISDLYSTIKKKTCNAYFSKIIEELDIKVDIEIIEALLSDVKNKEKCHTIDVCISHIHELIKKIKAEIESIDLKIIDQHYTYFYNKSPNFNNNIKNLTKLKDQLNKRVNTLIKVLSINL